HQPPHQRPHQPPHQPSHQPYLQQIQQIPITTYPEYSEYPEYPEYPSNIPNPTYDYQHYNYYYNLDLPANTGVKVQTPASDYSFNDGSNNCNSQQSFTTISKPYTPHYSVQLKVKFNFSPLSLALR